MDHPPKPLRLGQLLDIIESGTHTPKNLTRGDLAFVRQDYAGAAAAYQAHRKPARITKTKLGYCLALLDDLESARPHFEHGMVSKHPTALAVYAWVLAGSGGKNIRREPTELEVQIDKLLGQALAAEKPSQIVFGVVFRMRSRFSESIQSIAERACALYPTWDIPHGERAMRARRGGEYDAAQLDALLPFVPTTRSADVLEEAYVYALMLGRFDDADRAVDALEVIVAADPEHSRGAMGCIAEMRSMVDLKRAHAGEAAALVRVVARLTPYLEGEELEDPSAPHKFLLMAGLAVQDAALITASASQIAHLAWLAPAHRSGEGLEGWAPFVSVKGLDGIVCFGHFRFDFLKHRNAVAQHLTGEATKQWQVITALDAVFLGDPEPDQLQTIRSASPGLPYWYLAEGYSAFMDYQPADAAGAGALLANYCEWLMTDRHRGENPTALEITIDGIEVDEEDAAAVFEGAYSWLQANTAATGQTLLEKWGDTMEDADAGDVLGRIAKLSLSRGNSAIARCYLDKAEGVSERTRVLSAYGDPDQTRLAPSDLNLLEAAALIALLRGCTLNHVTWTTTPLRDAATPYDPTGQFIGVLFNLMRKGVIAVAEATPDDALTIEDGHLKSAYLDRVLWKVSAYTLDLQRAIRELPRSHWPDQWRAHAPVLARDIGVEELIRYIEHLLADRRLPAPDREELRPIFSQQLEQLSVSQCYYLAHKTSREALDYQALYRPGQPQLKGRVLNLLRGNGEKAVAHGWENKYERIRDVPESLLNQALHDVLTGWGARAFDQPMMDLELQTPESTTRH